MSKVLVFDMDGTIADFYGVANWLEYLEERNPTPYIIAKPIYDMDILASILGILRWKGYKVIITSWLSKDSTKEFDNEIVDFLAKELDNAAVRKKASNERRRQKKKAQKEQKAKEDAAKKAEESQTSAAARTIAAAEPMLQELGITAGAVA